MSVLFFLKIITKFLRASSVTKLVKTLCLVGVFSDVLLTSKEEIKAFPPPSPSCNVVPLFELPVENNKHPNFERRGEGGEWIVLFSEVTLFKYNFVSDCSLARVV